MIQHSLAFHCKVGYTAFFSSDWVVPVKCFRLWMNHELLLTGLFTMSWCRPVLLHWAGLCTNEWCNCACVAK